MKKTAKSAQAIAKVGREKDKRKTIFLLNAFYKRTGEKHLVR